MSPVDSVLAVPAPALRLMALEYLAELPDTQALQSLLVINDVLNALGFDRDAQANLLGTATANCLAVLADEPYAPVEPPGCDTCNACTGSAYTGSAYTGSAYTGSAYTGSAYTGSAGYCT